MTRMFVGFVFSTVIFAQNSFWVEERTSIQNGKVTPRVDGLINHDFKKKWGAFAWFQVQNGYSQSYGGATYSPKPWVQFALGAGIEEARNPARAGSYVWIGNKKNSALFIAEDGGSGFWYKVEALHTFTKYLSGGLLSERYKGTGPELRLKIPHTPISLWAAPMVERSRTNVLTGIRWAF
jgi:hypothetical protein